VTTSRPRVLLVEDDRFLRRVHEVALRQRGFVVVTASDGEVGLQLAQAERPDVILLDLVMPKLQGFEVLRLLKADPATEGIPVVILSSLSGDEDIRAAMKQGAAAFVTKNNFSAKELETALQEALVGLPRTVA
jgi:CheY-like chemotaxis protein